MVVKKEVDLITIELSEKGYKVYSQDLFVTQWNKGQKLAILNITDGTEVQFGNDLVESTLNRYVTNGIVEIPDIMLTYAEPIKAYIQVITANSETTEYEILIRIEERTKPSDYIYPEDEQSFREQMEAIMNDTKEIAQNALNKASDLERRANDGEFDGSVGPPGEKGEPGETYDDTEIKENVENVQSVLNDTFIPNISYIQSDGNQYINTGIVPDENTTVIIDYQMTDVVTATKAVFGSDGGSTTKNAFGIYPMTTGGAIAVGTALYNAKINTTDRYLITLKYGESPIITNVRTGETLSATLAGAISFTTALPLFLFAGNRNNEAKGLSNIKLYSFKVIKNDEVVMNLVPAYSNEKYCLYNTITKQYFYDSNGGTFTSDYETNAKKLKLSDNVEIPTPNYPELNDLPQINGIKLIGNKTLDELEILSKKTTYHAFNSSEYSSWITGSIKPSGGANKEDTTTIVTSTYLNIIDKNIIKIVCKKGYVARVAFYSQQLQSSLVLNIAEWQNPLIIEKPNNAKYMMIMLSREDGADISIEERFNCVAYYAYNVQSRVSILGDSISTFGLGYTTTTDDSGTEHKWAPEGSAYNYPGNRVRYPNEDITDVNQMWWKQVIDHFGWQLGINESWAGSRITWDGETENGTHEGADIHLASVTRLQHLSENGDPDIILIEAGGNDVNHLGLDLLGELPTADPSAYTNTALKELPVGTFYEAVTAMLLRLQYLYPKAKLLYILPYYCTNAYASTPYTLKQFNDAAIEVCDYLGVEYVDLRKTINIYDINTFLASDKLHPNAIGMDAIAESVIKKIKE